MSTEKKQKGRPSAFNERVQDIIAMLSRKGLTDKEMAVCCQVDESTFEKWKKAHPDFFRSLNDWKALADHEVERSLYERACGYSHPEDKVFNNNGEPLIVKTIKHYPPDPTAMIFWLKNRQPQNWRDKQEVEVTGEMILVDLGLGDGAKTEDSP